MPAAIVTWANASAVPFRDFGIFYRPLHINHLQSVAGEPWRLLAQLRDDSTFDRIEFLRGSTFEKAELNRGGIEA
jgi:hypothetical protein